MSATVNNEKLYEQITRRYSVRNYKSGISPQEMASLQSFANKLSGLGVRIALSRSHKIFSGKLFARRITGTECFAAVISNDGKNIYSGYLGEIFVLECVSRGYGTCWLGASYKTSAALDAIELADNEDIACVISIGIPEEEDEQPTRSRYSATKLTSLSKAELDALPLWQQEAIFAARLAPSAQNNQPWEFYVYDDAIGVANISRNLGFGMLDCGIAMFHAELGAKHAGVNVDWKMEEDEALLYPVKEPEYEDDDDFDESFDDDYEEMPDTVEDESRDRQDVPSEKESFDSDDYASVQEETEDDTTFN